MESRIKIPKGQLDLEGLGGETPSSIKSKYESNADTNAFTDADQTKVAAIDQAVSTAEKTTWNAKEPAITPDLVTKYWSGLKTWRDLATDVLAVVLGTYAKGAGTVASTDTIKGAIQKLDGNVDGKQDTLVSGTNIKTVNGASLLGSGDIPITGGGGASLSTANSWEEVQTFKKGAILAEVFKDINSSLGTLFVKHLVGDTNPLVFEFTAKGAGQGNGWWGSYMFSHADNFEKKNNLKLGITGASLPFAIFYGDVTINGNLTMGGNLSLGSINLQRTSATILEGGTYNALSFSIKSLNVGVRRTVEYRTSAGGGGGWHSMHRFIVKSNNDPSERVALEMESQDNGVPKITAPGIFKMSQLDLTSLGTYANDSGAATAGVPVGYGYINNATGAVHRRLT